MSKEKEVSTIDMKPGRFVPAPVHQQEQCISLIQLAIEKGADIVQLEKLMDLQERVESRQAIKEFNAAMSNFQSLLPTIEKTGVVDYTSSKGRTFYQYAKLEDIAAAVRPALKESGLSYRHTQTQNNGAITVVCIVTHASGHSEISELTSLPDVSGGKDPLKAMASAISYLRRYTLTGSLGIVVGGEDDDAQSAQEVSADKIAEDGSISDEEFNKKFPAWKKAIEGKKKTAAEMVGFLNNKGITFSENQLTQIYNLEKK